MSSMENKENRGVQLPLPGMEPEVRKDALDEIIEEILRPRIGELSNLHSSLPLLPRLRREAVASSLDTLVMAARILFESSVMGNLTMSIVDLRNRWSFCYKLYWKTFKSDGGVDGLIIPPIRHWKTLGDLAELAEELT